MAATYISYTAKNTSDLKLIVDDAWSTQLDLLLTDVVFNVKDEARRVGLELALTTQEDPSGGTTMTDPYEVQFFEGQSIQDVAEAIQDYIDANAGQFISNAFIWDLSKERITQSYLGMLITNDDATNGLANYQIYVKGSGSGGGGGTIGGTIASPQVAYGTAADTIGGSNNMTYDATLASGGLTISNTTVSTSSASGALVVTGGVGIGEALHVENTVTAGNNTVGAVAIFGNSVATTNPFGSLSSAPPANAINLKTGAASTTSGANRSAAWNYARHGDASDNPDAIYGIINLAKNAGTNNASDAYTYGAWNEAEGEANGGAGSSIAIGSYNRATNAALNWASFNDGPTRFQGVTSFNYLRVGGDYTLTRLNNLIRVTVSGFTQSMPPSPQPGDFYGIRNTSGGNTTLSGNGNNIEGAATLVLSDDESVFLVWDVTDSEWIYF